MIKQPFTAHTNTSTFDANTPEYTDYYDGLFYELYQQGREPFYPIPDQAQDFRF